MVLYACCMPSQCAQNCALCAASECTCSYSIPWLPLKPTMDAAAIAALSIATQQSMPYPVSLMGEPISILAQRCPYYPPSRSKFMWDFLYHTPTCTISCYFVLFHIMSYHFLLFLILLIRSYYVLLGLISSDYFVLFIIC